MSGANFHVLAKDAGNRLKSYILAYASGATGVFFLSLATNGVAEYSHAQKGFLTAALVFFVVTVALCLYELHIDARRFYFVAKQLSVPEDQQDWAPNERYKRRRVWLLYSSYVTVALGTLSAVLFLIARVV